MPISINNGVATQYGPRTSPEAISRNKTDYIHHLEIDIDFRNLPLLNNVAGLMKEIPADSIVTRFMLVSKTAWTSTSGTTTLNVGLRRRDGTVISANGFFNALGVSTLTADKVTPSTGALVNASVGVNDAYVTVTPSANDLTGGRGKILVEYLPRGMI